MLLRNTEAITAEVLDSSPTTLFAVRESVQVGNVTATVTGESLDATLRLASKRHCTITAGTSAAPQTLSASPATRSAPAWTSTACDTVTEPAAPIVIEIVASLPDLPTPVTAVQ